MKTTKDTNYAKGREPVRMTLYAGLVKKGAGRREEVLRGIWAGKGLKEIAADLGISAKTVEYYKDQLYRFFEVRDLVSLCRRAIEKGFIEPQERGAGARGSGARTTDHGLLT